MADTMRSDFPDSYCANCGSKGCHILHWGPIMGGKRVTLDNCILMLGENSPQLYDCDTGARTEEPYPIKVKAEAYWDYRGSFLWVKHAELFEPIYQPGDIFVKDETTYRVDLTKVTEGLYGGALIEYIVREVRDSDNE